MEKNILTILYQFIQNNIKSKHFGSITHNSCKYKTLQQLSKLVMTDKIISKWVLKYKDWNLIITKVSVK